MWSRVKDAAESLIIHNLIMPFGVMLENTCHLPDQGFSLNTQGKYLHNK